jgi:hypothetical protein
MESYPASWCQLIARFPPQFIGGHRARGSLEPRVREQSGLFFLYRGPRYSAGAV